MTMAIMLRDLLMLLLLGGLFTECEYTHIPAEKSN
jgi:hypothetical protein